MKHYEGVTAKTFKCPDCQAAPGGECTVPTDNSRKPVRWFHNARERLVDEVKYNDRCMPEWEYHSTPHKGCVLR
ncbi:hypothetical protein BH789_gp084 [Gordonia phage GMA6]|uniref:DNA-binding phage zinc finger domain-containing protein n=1 Tax=Gordonia phage GMA6 TaxID=1647285 RepID=A0A0K0NKV3_9CAUD|nr:hypothetical protein BH789_gp084 [Gordonia phage GMA6]AKL88365.1 hypothetical protein GMA6_84 [Gordonia phage GMA6]